MNFSHPIRIRAKDKRALDTAERPSKARESEKGGNRATPLAGGMAGRGRNLAQAERVFRPIRRLRLMIFRPVRLFIFARKPNLRFRLMLEMRLG